MKLLDPFLLGPVRLRNRVVMAPMTRNRADGTTPTEMMKTYYRQRASAGLVITEATQVDPMGQGYPNTPGIYTEEQVQAWKKITRAVHEEGGRIFMQLWHVGRISHSSFHDGDKPVAPSAVRPEGKTFTADYDQVPFETPRALELDEIPDVIEQFAHGARFAKEAGFDGVEVHGANGYLLDQFLQTSANRRTDAYGGSVANRARLLLEVTDAVLDVWGPRRVGVRLSPAGGFNSMHDDDPVALFSYVAEHLAERPLAYLHGIESEIDGTGVTAGELLRRHYPGTLMMAGGFDRETGEQALERSDADLIAYARLFLANPDLPERFAADAPLNEWDTSTFYGGGAEGYIDYPAMDDARAEAA